MNTSITWINSVLALATAFSTITLLSDLNAFSRFRIVYYSIPLLIGAGICFKESEILCFFLSLYLLAMSCWTMFKRLDIALGKLSKPPTEIGK